MKCLQQEEVYQEPVVGPVVMSNFDPLCISVCMSEDRRYPELCRHQKRSCHDQNVPVFCFRQRFSSSPSSGSLSPYSFLVLYYLFPPLFLCLSVSVSLPPPALPPLSHLHDPGKVLYQLLALAITPAQLAIPHDEVLLPRQPSLRVSTDRVCPAGEQPQFLRESRPLVLVVGVVAVALLRMPTLQRHPSPDPGTTAAAAAARARGRAKIILVLAAVVSLVLIFVVAISRGCRPPEG